MAILLIEQHGVRQAGTLNGRVLIGRWPENTIVIEDRAVSRIHAWIGVQGDQYYVADTGSRTGTSVNGVLLRQRHMLCGGDEIRIGPAVLHFQAEDLLPPVAAEIELTPRSPEELSGPHGEFMDCVCGAPLWLPLGFLGRGQCRYCGHHLMRGPVVAPGAPPVPPEPPIAAKPSSAAQPLSPLPLRATKDLDEDDFNAVIDEEFARRNLKSKPIPPAGRRVPSPAPTSRHPSQTHGAPEVSRSSLQRLGPALVSPSMPISPPPPIQRPKATVISRPVQETACGVCHSPITIFDEVTACPSCGLLFHTECWTENRGCSAYGCAQVGALGTQE